MNKLAVKPHLINKILIVGHPLSGYDAVQRLLSSRGMQAAQPSRRDNLTPEDISTTLLKAHNAQPLDPLKAVAKFHQINPGPVWQSLALDLLLGNIDNAFWGWADPQSVHLLDYWKALDPQLAFVLVYDTPQDLIAHAFEGTPPLTPEAMNAAIANWAAYNEALLGFYHRHPEHCLLIHAQQIRASADACLQQVRIRIGAPLLTHPEDTAQTDPSTSTELESDTEATPPLAGAAVTAEPGQEEDPGLSLRRYLAQALLAQAPATLQLYEELQSVANLPLLETTTKPTLSAFGAWAGMAAIQSQRDASAAELAKTIADHDALVRDRDALARQLQAQTQAKTNAEQQLQSLQINHDALIKESELMLSQLHEVQEELEKQFLDAKQKAEQLKKADTAAKKQAEAHQAQLQKIQTQLEVQSKAATDAKKQSEKVTALNNELLKSKQQLDAQLQAQTQAKTEVAQQLQALQTTYNKLAKENELLIPQLHQVQEELEKQLLDAKQKAEQLKKADTTAKKQAEAHQAQLQKVQSQLEAQSKAAADAKKKMEKLAQEKQTLVTKLAVPLPSSANSPELEQKNQRLLLQLHQAQEELEKYYLEEQRRKRAAAGTPSVTPTPMPVSLTAASAIAPAPSKTSMQKPYGAAEHVKLQLDYRLGAVMIERSRTLGGLFSLPVALISEARQYKREAPQRAALQLPPIEQYRDAHEAERVKQHLSYRLGQTVLKNVKSPVGWVKMPWALNRAVKDFRKQRRG